MTKIYGPQVVLRSLDLELSWGNFLVVFGPNGSGKTTLIKVLATIARPTKGEVSVAGFDLKRNPSAIRRNIGVVTHQPLLYGDLTGWENLMFYGRMFALPNLEERIEKAVDLMGASSFLGRKVGILSHGMQKRLSLARAILHDPPILLLDEPETGLDQQALEMLGQMMGTGERGRRTVLMATHSVERGLALGNQVAILSGGKIAFHEDRTTMDEAVFKGTYGRFTGVGL
ncbi:MAG: ABC transporter ATP-binding protein [Dehalococcoidia bacterium]|nr:ABC transporter ATP-binding protein [Dehalococcoidia bacterium]